MVLVKNISSKTISIKSNKLDPGKFILLLDQEFAEISDRLNKLERSHIVKIELEQWHMPKDVSPTEKIEQSTIYQEKPKRPTYVEEAEPPEPQEIDDPEPQARHSNIIVYQDKPKRKQYRKRRPPNPLK